MAAIAASLFAYIGFAYIGFAYIRLPLALNGTEPARIGSDRFGRVRKVAESATRASVPCGMSRHAAEVITADTALILDAHELAYAEQLSWFDALIVEAAIRRDCRILYSEDLGHDRRFGDLVVRNPFFADEKFLADEKIPVDED